MNRTVMAILGMLALALLPAVTMAKSHDAGQGGKPGSSSGSGPAPSPSAYEHADEKAKFLRDTHDMREHKGEEQPGGRDQAKDKDQAKGKDRRKALSRERSRPRARRKLNSKARSVSAWSRARGQTRTRIKRVRPMPSSCSSTCASKKRKKPSNQRLFSHQNVAEGAPCGALSAWGHVPSGRDAREVNKVSRLPNDASEPAL